MHIYDLKQNLNNSGHCRSAGQRKFKYERHAWNMLTVEMFCRIWKGSSFPFFLFAPKGNKKIYEFNQATYSCGHVMLHLEVADEF